MDRELTVVVRVYSHGWLSCRPIPWLSQSLHARVAAGAGSRLRSVKAERSSTPPRAFLHVT